MDDVSPFSEHDRTDEQPNTEETISSTLEGVTGVPRWELEYEQNIQMKNSKN